MRDLHSRLVALEGVNPIVMTVAVGAKDTGNIHLQGFQSAEVLLHIGAKHASDTLNGTNKITVKLEHADDDGTGSPGSYASVGADDVVGVTPSSGVIYTVDDAAKCALLFQCGYVGDKPFSKVTLTPTGIIANGVPIACEILKGDPAYVPAQ